MRLRLEEGFNLPTLKKFFPNLKVLDIWVQNPCMDLAERLFCSCPQLEDLSLSVCFVRDKLMDSDVGMTFNVSAATLKKLKIDFFSEVPSLESNLVIDAPKLESINITEGNMSCYFKNPPLLRLNEAVLHTGDDDIHAVQLLGALANTKYLCLPSQTTVALSHSLCEDRVLPHLRNLTTLKLVIQDSLMPVFCRKLLNRMPLLERLILDMEPDKDTEDRIDYTIPLESKQGSEPSFLSCLKKIEVLEFKGQTAESEMVPYFLRNCQSLCKMIVHVPECSYALIKSSGIFSDLPKASKNCVVEVV